MLQNLRLMGRGGVSNLPIFKDLIQWLNGGLSAGSDTEINDKLTLLTQPEAKQSNCATFDGVADDITAPDSETQSGVNFPQTRHSMAGHQGVIVGPDYLYIIDTARIDKREKTAPFTLIESQNSPFGGIPNVNHLGDGCFLDGKLYIPMERWVSCADNTDHYIGVYDAESMALENYYNIDAQGHETSGLGTDGVNLYCTSFCDASAVWKYTKTGGFIETISLEDQILPFGSVQGVTITDGEMYLSGSGYGIFVWDMSGSWRRKCVFETEGFAEFHEGLDFSEDGFNCYYDLQNTELVVLDDRQKLVKGFGVRSMHDLYTTIGEQGLFGKYNYLGNERQYYLHTGAVIQFRIGYAGGGVAVFAQIAGTSGESELFGKYTTDSNLVYVTDGTAEASAPFGAKEYKNIPQVLTVGNVLPGGVAPFGGKLINQKLVTILADDTEVVQVHYNFSEGSGPTVYDTSGNGNHGTITTGAGGLTTFWSGKQDVFHRNYDKGFSKVVNFPTGGSIDSAHIIGTETVSEFIGTSTPSVAAGTITLTAGTWVYLALDDGTIYKASSANGTTAEDTGGSNDGLIVSGEDLSIPALDNVELKDDVLGLGLTNPGGYAHNNSETLVQQTEAFENPFWFYNDTGYSSICDGVDDYIDLLGTTGPGTRLEVDGRFYALAANKSIFGISEAGANFDIRVNGSADGFAANLGDASSVTLDLPAEGLDPAEVFTMILDAPNKSASIAGVETSMPYTVLNQSTQSPYLFRRRGGGAGNVYGCVGLRRYEYGVLVQHLVPQADGTLQDVVNDVNYSNEGTGALGVGVASKKISFADLKVAESYTNNNWFKWISLNGTCLLTDILAYLQSKTFTQAEYERNERWLGDTSCGGGVAPYIILTGDAGESEVLTGDEGEILIGD
jgi:hypothetical protein